MISPNTAERLLEFGRRIDSKRRAREQLEGAVALHGMLEEHKLAYLADEVGMGKTYVALGVLALYRHFDPSFRALIIAPRSNIQRKWQNELGNFVEHNVAFSDLRVRDIDGRPSRATMQCDNLLSLVHQVGVDPDRDFFVRMPSFSLALSQNTESWKAVRERLRNELPWLPASAFDLRDKTSFKDRIACAICSALPEFDLVIVDEAHNLKHGFGHSVSSRNRMMGMVFGHDSPTVDVSDFKGYGPKARRVLFLSATPIEDDYRQLLNQLDVFGRAEPFAKLGDPNVDNDEKRELARKFLIRRVTMMNTGGGVYTKNQYRREWRRGGAETHDEPLLVDDQRERLVVALMQKKVSELLHLEQFGASFQVGMLASFESFLETSQTRANQLESADGAEGEDEEAATSTFDDADQSDDPTERHGIDVDAINEIARDHRGRFHSELPHPKMNALIRNLDGAWLDGRKALVFVRRVRSVVELKRRLDDRYDEWIIERLFELLPAATHATLDRAVRAFREQKARARNSGGDSLGGSRDGGDSDTFFAYFFRGDGPGGMVSGATLQGRFTAQSGIYATFFADNHVAWLLEARPGGVNKALARALGMDRETLSGRIAEMGRTYLSEAQRVTRRAGFGAAQAAALELLSAREDELGQRARTVWHLLYEPSRKAKPREQLDPELGRWLETPTFFTELRQRPLLREAIWPTPRSEDFRSAFREQELRAELLSSAARLGHAFIDLYALSIRELGSLESGGRAEGDAEMGGGDVQRLHGYLDLLEDQQRSGAASFGAFRELASIAEHFELVIATNASDTRHLPLPAASRHFGELLGRQQPIGGMTGSSTNQTLIRQFRMPGYPLVLIATDVLQEGEDLHTFCSRVYHYGISWTPSSMEQRIGRIDRVRSETDRRLSRLDRAVAENEKLQVYFPHLADSVESLQVRRVLRRVDRFLRLMHEGLAVPDAGDRKVNVNREMLDEVEYPEPIRETLRTAFDVPESALLGPERDLARTPDLAESAQARFIALAESKLGGLDVEWEPYSGGPLLGTAKIGARVQPFAVYLRSIDEHLYVRCISPVGQVVTKHELEDIVSRAGQYAVPVAAIFGKNREYDLSVEDDVLLGRAEHDALRVGWLVKRLASHADRLERALHPGRDAPLVEFRTDLLQEGRGDE